MQKHLIVATICCLSLLSSYAQNPVEIALWPEGVPESNGLTGPEVVNPNGHISNVSTPSMTIYPADPAKNTGAAIVICPGGGYGILAAIHEGKQFGEWLSENGITGVVLKYRMPNKHSNIPLKDAQQALRIVRSRATEWKINPAKVGISGFSAGGHLASTAGTHFDLGKPMSALEQTPPAKGKKIAPKPTPVSSYSCRPDFMILFYPVISLQEGITHRGSRNNLIGIDYNKDTLNYYSNELQVTKDTPPTLLFLSDNDKGVIPKNSTSFYDALKTNNIPAAMYIFPEGGHGWGYGVNYRYHQIWKTLYIDWLKQQKVIE